jgi:hypothetical protein
MTRQRPCIPCNSSTHTSRYRVPQNHGAQFLPHPHPPTPISKMHPPTAGIWLVVRPNVRDRIPNMSYLQKAYSPSTLPYELGGPPSNMHELPKSPATPTHQALRALQQKSLPQANRTRSKRLPRKNIIRSPRKSASAMERGPRLLGRPRHRDLSHHDKHIHHNIRGWRHG